MRIQVPFPGEGHSKITGFYPAATIGTPAKLGTSVGVFENYVQSLGSEAWRRGPENPSRIKRLGPDLRARGDRRAPVCHKAHGKL